MAIDKASINEVVRKQLNEISTPKRRAPGVGFTFTNCITLRKELERVRLALAAEEEHIRKICTHAEDDLEYRESLELDQSGRKRKTSALIVCGVCGKIITQYEW